MSDTTSIQNRLEELRALIRAESISYGEIAELQGLAAHIAPDDVELREWADVPEFPEDEPETVVACWTVEFNGNLYGPVRDEDACYRLAALLSHGPNDWLPRPVLGHTSLA